MSFSEIKGQDAALTLLQAVLDKRPSHCYLFCGPEGVGKKKAAVATAQYLNCPHATDAHDACDRCPSCLKIAHNEHPDVLLIEPDGASVKLEQVQNLTNLTALKSFEGGWQIIIINEAHLLTPPAANSLLKILEEPKEKTVFILITSKLEYILPTIRSRATIIKFQALSAATITDILGPEVAQAALLSAGSAKTALDIMHDEEFFPLRQEVLSFNESLAAKDAEQIIAQCTLWKVNKAKAALILSFSAFWYRDLLIRRVTNTDELIFNRDCSQAYQSFSSNADFFAILELIDKYQRFLKQNVYPELTLIVCFLQISAILKQD